MSAAAEESGARTRKVRRGYESIPRDVLQDERMSYRARGVLACLLSRPDGWRTSAERLAAQGKEGREAIRTALKELEQVGYLGRQRVQSPNSGTWSWIWIIGDDPEAVAAEVANEVRSRLHAVGEDS